MNKNANGVVRCILGKTEVLGFNDFSEVQPADWFPTLSEDKLTHFGAVYPNRIHEHKIDPFTYFCYVIRDGDHLVLIDAGVGDGTSFAPQWKGQLLQKLVAEGILPEMITELVFTHFHADHVGWATKNVDGVWQKTFPNARYIARRADYDAFHNGIISGAFPPGCFDTCIQPLVDRGEIELLAEDDYALSPAISLRHTPGHTPGSQCVMIRSQDECCALVGDCFADVIQVEDPELDYIWDIDKERAAQARKMILEYPGMDNAFLGGCHFGLGRLAMRNGIRYWSEL